MSIALATSGILARPLVFEFSRQVTLHPVERENLAAHRQAWGDRPVGDATLVDLLDSSGLTGSGGAHVDAAVKWRAAIAAGPGGTVVANAAEGEPVSAKDASLWLTRPQLVLDGLAMAAETIAARDAVVWVHRGATPVVDAITEAVEERGGRLPVPVRLILAPDRYVAGQSSAVVHAVRGDTAVPQFVPTGARSWGDGAPVLVHNTETLARVAQLARVGSLPVRQALVTVLEHGRRIVHEVDELTTFGELIDASAPPPSAVLLGGYGGVWHTWSSLAPLPVLSADIDLGAGVIALLPSDACGIAETSRVASWMAAESARGCGPCRFGLPDLAEELSRLAAGGRSGRAAEAALTIADLVDGRGACAHPDGVARMVRSSMRVFSGDVAAHRTGRCIAAHERPVFPLPTGARRVR